MSWRPRGKMTQPTARMRRDMFASRDFCHFRRDSLPYVYGVYRALHDVTDRLAQARSMPSGDS
jgi:hypothetical protein